MPNVMNYVRKYGNTSFEELPFNDADNMALCRVSYMQMEKVVTSDFENIDDAMTYGEAAKRLFELNGNKHVPVGLVLTDDISKDMIEMIGYPRYADMKITGCKSVYSEEEVVQFDAMTFLLSDGTVIIVFRGTDDTLIGWQEDMDILYKGNVPSYPLCLEYLSKAADKYSGNIILTGHSKGGNVALYAALHCSQEIRNRIIKIYNNEGPGFGDSSVFTSPEYHEIRPKYKHIVPSASFIGMMLEPDDDYTVVKSSKLLGPMQHDIATWQVNDTEPHYVEDLDAIGKANKTILNKMITVFTKEQIDVLYNTICTVVGSTGHSTLMDMGKNIVPSVVKMIKTRASLSEGNKVILKSIRKSIAAIVSSAIKQTNESVRRKVPELEKV